MFWLFKIQRKENGLTSTWGEIISLLLLYYIGKIEEVVKEGIEKGEIKEGNSGIIASEIFAFTCAGFMFKIKSGLPLDIKEMCIEFDKMIYGLKREK